MSGAQAAPAASPASPDRSISPPRSVSLPTLPNVQITHASFSNPIPGNGNPGVGKSTTESSSSTAMGTSARDSPSHAHHNNVLSRLSHLFHHEHANAQASSPGHSEPVAFPPNDDLDSDFGAEDSNAEKRSPQPQDPSPDAPRPQAPDRDAIKILVVTWNMGDALPKGDLSVLLGDVPAYQPIVAREAVEGLPRLPVENVHPYHVVVFAAQECPTPSGVPRGLGGGLMKGVGLQKLEGGGLIKGVAGLQKERKERDKDGKERDKDDVDGLEKEKDKQEKRGHIEEETDNSMAGSREKDLPLPPIDIPTTSTPKKSEKPDGLAISIGSSAPRSSLPPGTPTDEKAYLFDDERHTPSHGPAKLPAGMGPGPKGWSAMLEEWLCCGPKVIHPSMSTPVGTPINSPAASPFVHAGESQQTSVNITPTAAHSSFNFTSATYHSPPLDQPNIICNSPIDIDAPSPSAPVRSSTPVRTVPSKPIGIPGAAISTPTLAPASIKPSQLSSTFESGSTSTFNHSPLGTSVTATQLGTSAMSTASSAGGLLAPPATESGRTIDRGQSRSPSGLGIEIPDGLSRSRPSPREPGTGPYVNVAKERLLGLYLSVFVYRGCEHLVKGVDKDYVTTGLAGGRFGNKGGIGISLNLASHRLLFVNAHLAAHAERNDARLANIAKIKSELNLNCFLPPDDPRSRLDDITDRFDTTFWCGDLNFRVDISLLHAKWLLEQKKYQDALMFDQLKKAMEDPITNPLPGFQEAPIAFMPTFKYDVWKSVRATNRDIRRSLRKRRPTVDRHDRPAADVAPCLEFVPEGDGLDESGSDQGKAKSSAEDEEKLVEGEELATNGKVPEKVAESNEAGHIESEARAAKRSSTVPSLKVPEVYSDHHNTHDGQSIRSNGTFTETEPRLSSEYGQSVPRSTNSFGRSPLASSWTAEKPRGLKERTKKLLGILSLGKRPPTSRARTPRTDDDTSRRMSTSSYRSFVTSDDGRSHVSSDGGTSPTAAMSGEGEEDEKEKDSRDKYAGTHVRSASTASQNILASPPRRHISLLRRTASGRSMAGAGVPMTGGEGEYTFDLEDFDDTKDHRVGVYDTSKKQRVPSWCDRVLYKTHIVPDEEVIDDDESSRFEFAGRFQKISHALSNFGDHFRRRSTVFEPHSAERDRDLQVPSTPPQKLEGTLEGIPQGHVVDHQSGSPEQVPREFGDRDAANPRSLGSRSITFDGRIPLTPHRSPEAAFMPGSPSTPHKRRASSSTESTPSRRASLRRASSTSRRPSVSSSGFTARRRLTDGSVVVPSMAQLSSVKSTGHSLGDTKRRLSGDPLALTQVKTDTSRRRVSNETGSMNMFTRFLATLPGRFHSRVSLFSPTDDEVVDGRRERHLAGEIEVLHYGTIDDAGMRQLEGRSDHRPAIFAAALYV